MTGKRDIIREPDGINFIVKSPPLTEEDKALISAYIAAYKKKAAANRKQREKRAAAKHQVES